MKHDDGLHDAALLLARGVLGASIAAHGAQKLFGWFGGPGIEGTSQVMGALGFQPADRVARAASLSELAAGMMIATGAGGPVGPMLLMSLMSVAAGSVHLKNGYFNQNQGVEMNTMYALLALLLAVEDHGRFSLDELAGVRKRMRPAIGWLALAGGIGAAAWMLSRRTVPAAEPQERASTSEFGTIGAPTDVAPAT